MREDHPPLLMQLACTPPVTIVCLYLLLLFTFLLLVRPRMRLALHAGLDMFSQVKLVVPRYADEFTAIPWQCGVSQNVTV